VGTLCKHYSEMVKTVAVVRVAVVHDVPVPTCGILEQLSASTEPADHARQRLILNRMGGGPLDNTACRFRGSPPCPYYEAPQGHTAT
jgi:hypothetical protein